MKRFGKAYDIICMLTAVYISLSAPRMNNYTATHSVVRDRIYSHLRSGVWRNTGSHKEKGRLSMILTDHPGIDSFPWVLRKKLSNI